MTLPRFAIVPEVQPPEPSKSQGNIDGATVNSINKKEINSIDPVSLSGQLVNSSDNSYLKSTTYDEKKQDENGTVKKVPLGENNSSLEPKLDSARGRGGMAALVRTVNFN